MPDARQWTHKQVLAAARARRWTHAQTIAWMAFRSFNAVGKVALYEAGPKTKKGRAPNPGQWLAQHAALIDTAIKHTGGKARTRGTALRRVFKATRILKHLERRGHLTQDSSGHYRAAEVKGLFPSEEGRGQGRRKRPIYSYDRAWRLARFFLTSQRDLDWNGVHKWFRANELRITRREYDQLRPLALQLAERELAARKRWNAGMKNLHDDLTPEEAAQYEANLRSWRKVGRPRKSPARPS